MAESKRKNANAESSEDSENPENSELEVMREKIRKLEADLAMKEKELMSYQIDHLGAKENEVVDIILVFMNNNGFTSGSLTKYCHSWTANLLFSVA